MYISGSLSSDIRSPWKRQNGWTKRVHEASGSSHPHSSSNTHTSGLHFLAQVSHDVPSEALQYAPPLSAYSAETSGSNYIYTEYNKVLQLASFTGLSDIPLLSPQTSKRLDALRKIKATGYDTISPIGINKTMREIDYDTHSDEEEPSCTQAENSLLAGTNPAPDNSNSGQRQNTTDSRSVVESSGVVYPRAVSTSALLSDLNRDLDAHVVDADISDFADPDRDLGSGTPDAFMAEDVEYQDDHSLSGHSRVLSGSYTESQATASAASSGFSAPHTAVLSATSTLATTATIHRNCDDSDVDMTLED